MREVLVAHGARPTETGCFTFHLQPGDPAVYDSALTGGARLLNEAAASPAIERDGLQLLVSPAEATVQAGTVREVEADLAEDLRQRPPSLQGGSVHLTSHSAHMLEDTWRLSAGRPYRRPSGKEIPLWRADGPGERRCPWRNPDLLDRPTAWIARPELEERLADRLDEPALLLTGPLGSGKTRLAHSVLARHGLPHLTMRAGIGPHRERLVWQIARQLLLPADRDLDPRGTARFASPGARREAADRWHAARSERSRRLAVLAMLRSLLREQGGPLCLVCDDAERLGDADLELLSTLTADAGADTLRLWIVARPDRRLGDELGGICQIRTGLLDAAEHRRLAQQLTSGWALPDGILEALVEESRGNPFALEELLVAMARRKLLRRSYGSFFYSGPGDTRPEPSRRWIAHLHSEASRLGLLEPLLTLAVAEGPLPTDGLTADPAGTPAGWEEAGLRAGLLRRAGSPWGLGLELACPAYGRGLAALLDAKDLEALRRRIGEMLAGAEHSGGSWRVYRLLRGSQEAVPALLRATRETEGPPGPRDPELLAALTGELAALRAADPTPDAELVLLWRLLQVARRVGRVGDHLAELDRALALARAKPERYLALSHLKAEVEHELGRHRDAERTLLRALEVTDGHASAARRAPLMVRLARLYMDAGRLTEAERLLESLYPAMQREGLDAAAATCRFLLGNIARRRHLYPQALAHHDAALEARRRLEHVLEASASLCALGTVAATMGNYPRALAYYEDAEKTLAGQTDCDRDLSFALLGRARVLGRLGDFSAAASRLKRAVELREGRDDKAAEAIARLALAANLLDRERREEAFEEAGRARFQLELLGVTPVLADADQLLGRVQLARRHLAEAEQHLAAALEGHRRQQDEAACAFDLAWLIELAQEADQVNAVDRRVRELQTVRARLSRVEMAEVLDHRLFRALEWLAERRVDLDDPLPYLQRAYEQVLGKAGHLRPEHRHRFLYDVRDNREVVEAATRLGLELL